MPMIVAVVGSSVPMVMLEGLLPVRWLGRSKFNEYRRAVHCQPYLFLLPVVPVLTVFDARTYCTAVCLVVQHVQ
jgi:hypothetical protein